MRAYALKVNQILQSFFGGRNVDLVDFKLEFGRCPSQGGRLLLGDEITPDGWRLSGEGHRPQARQGPLPPGPRPGRGGLRRGGAPRHPLRARARPPQEAWMAKAV